MTTLVPVISANLSLSSHFVTAYFRTIKEKSGPQNWWRIEIRGTAASLIVIRIIVAVLLGSLIGASQSEKASPCILHCLGGHDQGECAIAHGFDD